MLHSDTDNKLKLLTIVSWTYKVILKHIHIGATESMTKIQRFVMECYTSPLLRIAVASQIREEKESQQLSVTG